jgi:hypothetical protein
VTLPQNSETYDDSLQNKVTTTTNPKPMMDSMPVNNNTPVKIDPVAYQKKMVSVFGMLIELSKTGKRKSQDMYEQAATELCESTIAIKQLLDPPVYHDELLKITHMITELSEACGCISQAAYGKAVTELFESTLAIKP